MNQSLKFYQTIVLAFVIFAIFFGAGNIIFPPIVGFQAGDNAIISTIGFLLTAVGLPTISIIAFATIEGNLSIVTNKISKNFDVLYCTTIYLLIGPMFAIPRTAIVANEMSAVPFIPLGLASPSTILLIFSFIYFLCIYIFSIYASKTIEIISKYIIPILLITILVLTVGAIINPITTAGEPMGNFYTNPFITGILDGFLTMDSLGTFIVVSILITKLNEMGITESSAIIKYTIRGGIIAGIALCIVYSGLAYIGFTSDVPADTTNGGVILVRSALNSFGFAGILFLALAVFIACITTAITLSIGFGRYLHKIIPSISYKNFLRICLLFSFIVSNLGFDTLMSITVPVLDIAYPITIVLIAFTFLRNHINGITSRIGMVVCAVLSILYVLYSTFNINFNILTYLPFFKEGLGWIFPTIIAVAISYFITSKNDNKNT